MWGRAQTMVWALFGVVLWLPAGTAAQDSASTVDQTFHYTSWQAGLLSWQEEGSAGWLMDSEGNLRCEIMVTAPGSEPGQMQNLLTWTGAQGWTLISLPAAEGTHSRWHEAWEPLPAVLDTWLRFLTAAILEQPLPAEIHEITPGGRTLMVPRLAGLKANSTQRRFELDDPTASSSDPGFRAGAAGRGLGRGGAPTVLTLAEPGAFNKNYRISSSRHPGTLTIQSPSTRSVVYEPSEVFLPWWPLADFLEFRE